LGADHVFPTTTPKAVIDVILGIIAIAGGSRTLKTYVDDMRARGQDEDRIKEVTAALKPFADNKDKPLLRFE